MTLAPRSRTLLRSSVTAASAALLLALTACGGGAAGDTPASSSAAVAGAGSAGACGVLGKESAPDPDGVLANFKGDALKGFANYPYPVAASKWKDLAAKKGPLKIGYVSIALMNDYNNNALKTTEAHIVEYSKDGVVDSTLLKGIPADAASQTPAEQIKLYNQLVDQGVDGIILGPLSGDAMADAVTAAGKKGIPTVALNTYIPSEYAISTVINPYLQGIDPAANTLKQLGGKGNVLIVRGIPGETNDAAVYPGFTKMLEGCPDIKVAGEVVGGYSNATAKSEIMKFLASHPGKIDMVFSGGVMGPGIIAAFEQSGREVPAISFSGLQAGDSAWWNAKKDNYTAFGTVGSGNQTADLAWRVMIRTLTGQGPKINNVVTPDQLITNETVGDMAPAGGDLNSAGEVGETSDTLISEQTLDQFFAKPTVGSK